MMAIVVALPRPFGWRLVQVITAVLIVIIVAVRVLGSLITGLVVFPDGRVAVINILRIWPYIIAVPGRGRSMAVMRRIVMMVISVVIVVIITGGKGVSIITVWIAAVIASLCEAVTVAIASAGRVVAGLAVRRASAQERHHAGEKQSKSYRVHRLSYYRLLS
jgi:hypothetical protein